MGLSSPCRRATVAAKKSQIMALLMDAQLVLLGCSGGGGARKGGGDSEAYDSADNKWALCIVLRAHAAALASFPTRGRRRALHLQTAKLPAGRVLHPTHS